MHFVAAQLIACSVMRSALRIALSCAIWLILQRILHIAVAGLFAIAISKAPFIHSSAGAQLKKPLMKDGAAPALLKHKVYLSSSRSSRAVETVENR